MQPPTDTIIPARGRTWVRWLLIAVLILGSLVFLWRGPIRAVTTVQHDFALIYASARAWLVGMDPYTADDVRAAWAGAAGLPDRDPMGGRDSNVLLYPPGAFVVLAPVAALPWPIASIAWAGANTLLFGVSVWAIAALAWPRDSRCRTRSEPGRLGLLAFVALAIWLAPAATNAGLGQTAMLSMVLIAAAQVARQRAQVKRALPQSAPSDGVPQHPVPSEEFLPHPSDQNPLGTAGRIGSGYLGLLCGAGIALGAATALKPQMALLFVVYELGRRRWQIAAIAAGVCVLFMLIGAGRMQLAGIDWWTSWQANLGQFTVVADGDPTRTNAIRHHMLNLHYPLHNFTDHRQVVRLAVLAILGILSLAYFLVDRRRGQAQGEDNSELLSLSMAAVVTLLIVYHRFYDAVLLLFPLALAIKGLVERYSPVLLEHRQSPAPADGARTPTWARGHEVTLLLLVPFFIPGAALLDLLARRGWIPEQISTSWLWEVIILPHQPWALLALCIWLVVMRSRATTAQR
jgi:hypothetical protein